MGERVKEQEYSTRELAARPYPECGLQSGHFGHKRKEGILARLSQGNVTEWSGLNG